MEVFVGTSGWMHGWNEKRSLDWYVQNSGLNAVRIECKFLSVSISQCCESLGNQRQTLEIGYQS
jgi:hypothetical protein